MKTRFFDRKDKDILAITTNYLINEWLDEADKRVFEKMKQNNPRRYQVAGLGNWGIVDGLVYENWEEKEFSMEDIRNIPNIVSKFGLDFGYTNDPTALFCGMLDKENATLYVFDEFYQTGMQNKAIYDEVERMGYGKEKIVADSSEPKSIDNLYDYGMRGIRPARKGKDSIMNGVDYIQGLKIIIHPRCVNFITEISNYTWQEDKFGKKLNKPIDDSNHLMDAMRYALEEDMEGDIFSFR